VWNKLQRGPPPCYSAGARRGARGPGQGWALCLIRRSNVGVVVRDDQPHATRHGRQARDSARLGPWSLHHFRQVVLLGFPRTVLSTTSNAVQVDRSRAIPYSTHGVERETRLELATLTLARYRSNSVFGRGPKWPLNHYLPPSSTGIHADPTGTHTDHTGLHADHKSRNQRERAVEAACGPRLAVAWRSPNSANRPG